MTTQTDILNNDGSLHLLAPPFTIRSYTVVNSGALSVFIQDGQGNILDVVDPGETSSANATATTLGARFAAATTGSAMIITSDTPTQPASSYTPGFGPSAVTVITNQVLSPGTGLWSIADTFTYAKDVYELLWWRLLIVATNTITYNLAIGLQSPTQILDFDIAVCAPQSNATTSGRAAGREFSVPPQVAMSPGAHFLAEVTAANLPPAGVASGYFALAVRRRTFTS